MNSLLYIIKSYISKPQFILSNIIWRFPKKRSDLEVIFIVGAPRSGTTLLQRIIASNSLLFTIEGETGLFTHQNIFNRKHFGFSMEENVKLFYESTDIVDFFDKGVRKLSEKNNGKIFVEKTPQHILRLPFMIKYFPNGKFIHIVRDGRDCFCSAKRHPNIPQKKSVITFAKYWKKCVMKPTELAIDNIITIKYENFVSEPEIQLGVVMEFLKIPFDKNQLNPSVFGVDHRAGLDEFKLLRNQVTATSVGKWRMHMREEENNLFQRAAGSALTFYGYD